MRIKIILIFFTLLLLQSCQKESEIAPLTLEKSNLVSNFDSKIIDIWTNVYLTIEKDLPNFRPAATCRALAYINLAAYETCRFGMPDFISNQHHLPDLRIPNLPYPISDINWNAALNACYATTLKHFLVNATVDHLDLINATQNSVSVEIRDKMFGDVQQNSLLWGQTVANAIIEYSKTDINGESQSINAFPTTYQIPIGQGKWEPATTNGLALFPFWGTVRTFAIDRSDLLSLPPYPFSSLPNSIYFKQHLDLYNSVKNLNHEQKWLSEFWSDDIVGFTFSPPARLFAIGLQVMKLEHMNLEESLHFFCKLGIAVNDGAVAAWESKYYYNTERPGTFIRKYIDPEFKSYLGTAIGKPGLVPPFPGYPSGHSTFSGILQEIFTEFFGANYTFTDNSHKGRTDFLSQPRTFSSWKQLAEENAFSRIPLGVHIKMDCDEGLRLGSTIGKKVLAYKLKI